jgi:hypothetical protein
MFYLRKQHVYRDEADENGESGGAAPEGDGGEGEGESQTEGESHAQTVAPEIEAEARKMGWTEKSEFKGDPAKWRPADEFVERGRNMLPILRKTVEKQQNELADLKKSMKEFAEYHSKTEQRAYAKAYGDLKAQQMEAVAAGNTEAFKQIDQEIEDLQKEVSSKKPITVPKDDNPEDDPVYMDWASRNKWVDTDPEMSAYAEGQGLYLSKARKLRGAELLEEVSKAVKAKFPDKFQNPRRNSAPAVEGATSVAKKGNGKSYADMPKEDRETCDRLVKRYGISKDEYVKNYFEE